MHTELVRVKVEHLEELFEQIARLREIVEIRDNEIIHLKHERAELTKEEVLSRSMISELSKTVKRKNQTIESLRNAPSVEVPFFDIKQYA